MKEEKDAANRTKLAEKEQSKADRLALQARQKQARKTISDCTRVIAEMTPIKLALEGFLSKEVTIPDFARAVSEGALGSLKSLYDEAVTKSTQMTPEPFSVAMDQVARTCADAEDKKLMLQGFLNA